MLYEEGTNNGEHNSLLGVAHPSLQAGVDGKFEAASFASEGITVYRRRFLVLFVFILFNISNQMQFTAFATIVRQAQRFYSASAMQVNMLSALYPVLFCIGIFPTCAGLEHAGLRFCLLAGNALNAAGAILKLVSALWLPHYWLLVIAQICNAAAQLMSLSTPPLIASTWFPVDERTLATAVGTLFGFVGLATGMFYSPRVVTSGATSDDEQKHQMVVLWASQVALGVIPLIGCALFVPDAPPTCPSPTARGGEGSSATPSAFASPLQSFRFVMNQLWVVLRDFNFLRFITGFGLINGTLTALATVFYQVMEPYGVSETQAGVILFTGILAGAANCAVVGQLIDTKRRYKFPLLALSVSAMLLCIVFLSLLYNPPSHFVVYAYVIPIAIEVILMPLIPICLELSVELTYPKPESVSTAAAMSSLSFYSIVFTIILSVIITNNPTKLEAGAAFATVVGSVVVGVALLFSVRERLGRKMAEEGEALTSQLFL